MGGHHNQRCHQSVRVTSLTRRLTQVVNAARHVEAIAPTRDLAGAAFARMPAQSVPFFYVAHPTSHLAPRE